MNLHTYHHLCSTLLLSTPYSLASLPRRAPPAEDGAYILPLPDLSRISSALAAAHGEEDVEENGRAEAVPDEAEKEKEEIHNAAQTLPKPDLNDLPQHLRGSKGNEDEKPVIYPSLLSPHFRPARKLLVVRREDGYEVRRVWRCGRCGGVVGYEIVGQGHGDGGGEGEKGEAVGEDGKVLYLIEGEAVETGSWGDLEEG